MRGKTGQVEGNRFSQIASWCGDEDLMRELVRGSAHAAARRGPAGCSSSARRAEIGSVRRGPGIQVRPICRLPPRLDRPRPAAAHPAVRHAASGRIVDVETAERVEDWRALREFLPAPCAPYRPRAPWIKSEPAFEVEVDELHVELGIVDDQRRIADKIEELVDHLGEFRLVAEEFGGEPWIWNAASGMSRSGLR